MEAWEWKLIRGECTGCGICADVCTHDAITMTRAMSYPGPGPSPCTGCMSCVTECPFGAIEVLSLLLASDAKRQ